MNLEESKVGIQGTPNQLQIKKVLSEELREQNDLQANTPLQKGAQEETDERQS